MILQFEVTQEQIDYAHKLVVHSMKNHKVPNIWDSNKSKKDKTYEYRFTGTLGEILFADIYGLNRPARSFGAVDGQDLGKDFELVISNKKVSFDIKTMKRRVTSFFGNYVLNIPSSQLKKSNSLTDAYFNISLCEEKSKIIASFIGFVKKSDILSGKVGIFYPSGTKRVRSDGTSFVFQEDTYEIDFKDFELAPKIITEPFGTKYISLKE